MLLRLVDVTISLLLLLLAITRASVRAGVVETPDDAYAEKTEGAMLPTCSGGLREDACSADDKLSPTIRGIAQHIGRMPKHWVGDGFHVRPSFGHLAFSKHLSPFLMLDYAREKFKPTKTKRRGVGQHPHRGFETVTIAYQGEIEHADSAGNGGIIKKGDVQWMTAGRGIIHEEFHSTKWSEGGGVVEMVQLWVNLPKKYKMIAPSYQGILKESIPNVQLCKNVNIRIIAGKLLGQEGPASTWSEMNLWDMNIRRHDEESEPVTCDIPISPNHNSMLFIRRGKVVIWGNDGTENKSIRSEEMVLMKMDGGNTVRLSLPDGTNSAKLLLLSGVPLDEPIAHSGPFVMNTRDELRVAQQDYRSGRMGR